MKKSPVITLQGKTVTAQQIAGIAAKFSSQSESVTLWANYCAIHAVVHHNSSPLTAMLQNPAFKLASGKPSKLGKEVFAYVKAHAPQLCFDEETGKASKKELSDNNPLKNRFQNPAELDENGKPTIVEPGDFALSFDEWRTLEKPSAEKAAPKVKAATVAKKLAEVKEALGAGKLVASAEELAELAEAAKALFMALDAQHSAEVASAEPIDAGKAAELLKSGQGGKSTRAGGKVANA